MASSRTRCGASIGVKPGRDHVVEREPQHRELEQDALVLQEVGAAARDPRRRARCRGGRATRRGRRGPSARTRTCAAFRRVLTSTFSDSSLPSGTSGLGMLGTRSRSAPSSLLGGLLLLLGLLDLRGEFLERRERAAPSRSPRASGISLLFALDSALRTSPDRFSSRTSWSIARMRSTSTSMRFLTHAAFTWPGFSRMNFRSSMGTPGVIRSAQPAPGTA